MGKYCIEEYLKNKNEVVQENNITSYSLRNYQKAEWEHLLNSYDIVKYCIVQRYLLLWPPSLQYVGLLASLL